ncbi:Protein CBG26886 [Caenorhabditis briggsae]|uniref:Protein CBG26886 n=1 Tax=Caenorhabditis briggsae TaxID=6238 RepID=B6II86_CAEBR|nr:Protein CBG26886 [Caenorhabditis briggsae]CAR99616.1 Protein CBG26886 [Caenorhabditis briggsae]
MDDRRTSSTVELRRNSCSSECDCAELGPKTNWSVAAATTAES